MAKLIVVGAVVRKCVVAIRGGRCRVNGPTFVAYSASHFSHFLTYLSSSSARSRMTNVRTTFAKNSEARLSFISDATLQSAGNAVYSGAMGEQQTALVCSSSICALLHSFSSPWT